MQKGLDAIIGFALIVSVISNILYRVGNKVNKQITERFQRACKQKGVEKGRQIIEMMEQFIRGTEETSE